MNIFLEIFGSDFQALVIASAATVELNFIKSDLTEESSRFFVFFFVFRLLLFIFSRMHATFK